MHLEKVLRVLEFEVTPNLFACRYISFILLFFRNFACYTPYYFVLYIMLYEIANVKNLEDEKLIASIAKYWELFCLKAELSFQPLYLFITLMCFEIFNY